MAANEEIFTLHRYFLWANRQRDDFHTRVKHLGRPPQELDDMRQWVRATFVNLAPWLGSLYVVAEGWNELTLSDPKVDKLLASPHVARLRRFRNGVFHFQREYFDDRFLAMFHSNGVPWAQMLHDAFGTYFKQWYKGRGITVQFDESNHEVIIVRVARRPAKKA